MSCACPVTGTAACHCAACHETFTGAEAFDMHQRWHDGQLACLPPGTALDAEGRQIFARQPSSGYWQRARQRTERHPAWAAA